MELKKDPATNIPGKFTGDASPELSMGWVDPRVELGWVGWGWVKIFSFLMGWVGSWVRKFPKIIKLGRPLVTGKVIPDNLIMINTDK